MKKILQLLSALEDTWDDGRIIACQLVLYSDGSGELLIEDDGGNVSFDFNSTEELNKKLNQLSILKKKHTER